MIAANAAAISPTPDTSLAVPVGPPLVSIIKTAYAAGVPLMIEGPHGVGKSESVHEAARQLQIPIIDRDLSIVETSDICGYPYREDGFTKFAPPDFLPKSSQPCGLLLLEELNRSSESTRHAALQILTARRIHDLTLSPGWLPLTTVNPREAGRYFTAPMDLALLSRFIRVTVKADPALWLEWARGVGGVHPLVTDYIALLDNPFSDAEGFSTPRSWTYVSKVLSTVPDLQALVPIAWWITPAQEPRRFDTRFFFALVPPAQRHSAAADGVEVEDGLWLAPQAALDGYRRGELRLAPPTLATLEELAPLRLSQVARHPWPTAPVEPVINEVEGRLVLALPGDPLHPVATAVWPHRTRIVTDDAGRFVSARFSAG